MEESKSLSSSSSSSSLSLSSISIPESSAMPGVLKTPKFKHLRTMQVEKDPTFVRFIRANTQINTHVSALGDFKIFDYPDVAILKSDKNKGKNENKLDDDKKELLQNFIKIREATDYEIIEKKKIIKKNEFLRAFFLIKTSISELSRIIIKNIIFEVFIILTIFVNTITISIDSLYTIPTYLDNMFLWIYTVECMLKILGYGLYRNSNSYLRDKWNILDLSIVITGWIESLQFRLNILRMLRILRPLRNISSIKGLRVIFMALLQAARPLGGTLGTLIFFIFIFAIAGLETMMGSFRYRCMDLSTGTYGDDTTLCGNTKCHDGWVCVQALFNPNYDNTSFDSIFYALIIVFECVTLQTWVPLMNLAQSSLSQATVLYFLPLSFVGAFLILNLSLAVIKSSFTKSMSKVRAPKINPDLEEKILDESLESEKEEDAPVEDNLKHVENSETTLMKRESLISISTQRDQTKDIRIGRRSSSSGFKIDFDKLFIDSPPEKTPSKTIKYEEKPIIDHFRKGRRSSTLVMALLTNKIANKYLSEEENLIVNDFKEAKAHEKKEEKLNRTNKKKLTSIIATGIGKSIYTMQNSLERFNNYEQEANSIHLLHRLKNSIVIRKDLIDKMKKNKKIGKIKIFISENYKFSSDSIDDIIPKLYGFELLHPNPVHLYKFSYKRLDNDFEDELERKWRLESEYFFSKHSEYEKNIKIFKNLSLKCGCDTAFNQIMGLTVEKVRCIEFEDEIKQSVEGYWSGYDVFQDDERNEYFSRSLSVINSVIWSQGFAGNVEKMQFIAKKVENSKVTVLFMILVVCLNSMILSFEYYGMSPEMDNAITTMNLVFNIIFICELAIRIISLGITEFCRDAMNYIDAVVIILSFMEFSTKIGSSALSAFRVVRIIRILRIYRFARLLPFMKSLVCVITYSLPKFFYLALLLALLNLVYALLGYQIFAGTLNFQEEFRSTFDNFGWAYLTVFQVLTLSHYSTVLYHIMRSTAGSWGCLYIFVWIIIGNFVVLNLFIAILLDSFIEEGNDSNTEMNLLERTLSISKTALFANNRSRTLRKREAEKIKILQAINCDGNNNETKPKENAKTPLFYNIGNNKSCMLFSKENSFRIFCYKVFDSKWFNLAIFIIIYLNCIVLVWETYTNSSSNSKDLTIINILELLFTIFYLSEFLIKSIAIGLFKGENSYFKNYWNILDFSIMIISVVDSFTLSASISSIKAFRVIRALRPLRFISKNKSMKQLVSALISSLGAIGHVILILIVVWFMFAILGVSIFSGKLYTCSNPNYEIEKDCINAGYLWENADLNFDNVFEAFLSLFIVGLLEGWQEVMYSCIDARGIGISPKHNNNMAAAYYFVFFIYVGSFFFLHLFMGVVFLKFHQVKREESSIHLLLLNTKQQFWIELQRLIVTCSPNCIIGRPDSKFKSKVYSIVTHKHFEMFTSGVIVVNMLILSMSYQGSSINYQYTLDMSNMVCDVIFTLETMLKMYAFELKHFFKSKLNIFDLFVIVCAYIDIILDSQVSKASGILKAAPQLFRVFRIFRVTRLIRIFKPLKNLQNLITIIKHSLPAILNVVSLLILCIFIYAIIGVFLFSNVKYGLFIDEYNNFQNFLSACTILIRITTGGDWPQIMLDCAATAGRSVSALYFCSYIFTTILVVLNLFIMVIIQNYEDFESNPNSSLHIFTKQVRKFNRSWEIFSNFSHGIKIQHKNVKEFMIELGPEIGFNKDISFEDSIKLLSEMSFVIDNDGNIAYHDMLYAVLNRMYGVNPDSSDDQVASILLRKEERETFQSLRKLKRKTEWKIFKKHTTNKVLDKKKFTKEANNSRNVFLDILFARKLLRGWRNVVVRRKNGEVILTEKEEQEA